MTAKKLITKLLHFVQRLAKPLSSNKGRITSGVSAVIVIVSIVTINFEITKNSPAQAYAVPTTPTVPICGLRNTADDGEVPTNLPNPAYTTPIAPGTAILAYQYWPGGSGQDPRWYFLTSASGTTQKFSVYDAASNASIGSFSFTLPANLAGESTNSSFAVDPSGNVYIGVYNTNTSGKGASLSQWLWSPGQTTATLGWSALEQPLLMGAPFGYTDSGGTYRIAIGLNSASTMTFNASTGASMGTIAAGPFSQVQPAYAHNNDNVTVDGTTVTIWNSTFTTQLFTMSAGSTNTWAGDIAGVNELADGTIAVTSYISRSMFFFSSTGAYLGKIGADAGAGDPLDDITSPSSVAVVGSTLYYEAEHPFSQPNVLVAVPVSAIQQYLAAPQGAPYHMGLGANIDVNASKNYFPSGTTPQVNLTFNQWWQATAAGYTGQYAVRSATQIEANNPQTWQSFSIPSTAGGYTNGTATIPLTLPAATPGFYEVSVQLLQGGTVVGADCAVYSVGASSDSFTPDSYPSSTDAYGVAIAHAFGQKLYRSQYNLDSCFPGVTTPTSTTALACPSSMDSDIAAAATLAAQDGVVYDIQLGTGVGIDTNAISSGQWQRLITLMAAHYPEVTDWECWNEPDNNSFSSPSDYVNNALEPCYNAVKSVSSSDKMIGISNEGHSSGAYASYVNAGALNYLDIVAIHAYTGYDQSFEEQGEIEPSIYNGGSANGGIDQLVSYLASKGYTGPIYDTESGFWNNTPSEPYDYYKQGDMLVSKMILEQSIGMNWLSNFYNQGGYTVDGAYWSLMDGASGGLNPGGLAALNYQTALGGRSFLNWLPTSTPHTYAALYGPSSSSTDDVVAIWSDDYSVNVTPALSGGGSIAVTSEYGAQSTTASGSGLTIDSAVQYLSVPAGHTLSVAPSESYGTNYALASGGATVTSSSNYSDYSCSSGTHANPAVVLNGTDHASGSNELCGAAWSAAYSDSNPTLTITLAQPQTIDRVFLASTSIGSVLTGLRDYTVQVNSGNGTFNTVASVSNSFFDRSHLLSFSAQTVSQIRITNMDINYSGYGDGLPPSFWSGFSSGVNLTNVYDVEAYSPGTGQGAPPTVAISSPANNAVEYGNSATVAAVITPASGNTITSANLFVDGAQVQSLTSAPFNFAFNPLNYLDGTYDIEVQGTDNHGTSAAQYETIKITNGDLNSDSKVNLTDLVILAQHYGATGVTYNQGDINADNKVNVSDLVVLAKNYGYAGQ